jgi:hypothetical protein
MVAPPMGVWLAALTTRPRRSPTALSCAGSCGEIAQAIAAAVIKEWSSAGKGFRLGAL